jgi:metal-dependent amidase/aminoacylase/carboxypeptidase family protein
MLTADQIAEWNDGPDETPFWKAIRALTPEEREKLAELASEDIKNAAAMILAELKREKGDV